VLQKSNVPIVKTILIITFIVYYFFIGRIINIVSILGRIAMPLRSPYCTVKFGVEAFSDCLRLEMRRWGVDVIVVEPGDYTTGKENMTNPSFDIVQGRLATDRTRKIY
jgi:NAD(P)-dependent dehydrogenase (short-subunit alcohol dehydrogenase family)